MRKLLLVYLVLFGYANTLADDNVPQFLQDISVTIKSEGGPFSAEGSGVIVTRDVGGEKVNFVWTAGHVVDNLRTVRKIVDPSTGSERQVVEFKDASIVKELNENGRRVGELKMDAKVLCYSNHTSGDDLALLMVRKRNFVDASAKFYLENQIPQIGTNLYHVGSLLGQMGANSMTPGIMSQIGRVLDNNVYDQTTVHAFPGSSGGGVYLTDGQYVGMLVRGAGETFNLIVPVRRMREWAKKNKIEFALDPTVPTPSFEELEKIVVEDIGHKFENKSLTPMEAKRNNFKIHITEVFSQPSPKLIEMPLPKILQ